ncbi:DUF6677 family protein [Haloarchaeobius sp. TZWWS8]|uniref:DUF6677 family protein n=1 Tax=Haloarchaeobius sp. TZWWS8 TaxID=3446121 RepID=UPI003EB905EC
MVRVRVVVAVVLSFIFPGLGHVYLRRWVRSLLFIGFTVTLAAFALPQETVATIDSVGQVVAMASNQVSMGESFAMTLMQVSAMTDAYLLATSAARTEDGGPRCPNCGKELDGDIGFCPWCAHELNELRR